MRRRSLMLAGAAVMVGRRGARAAESVKLGVLTDLSGPFKDQVGPGSVAAAELAAADFAAEGGGPAVTILSADHLNKPDIGSAIARRWVDEDGVDAIVDLPNSGVALAVSELLRQKDRVCLASSTATSDLTGKACSPNTIQWVLDTWSLGNSAARALIGQGGQSWFFITVDYALGHALRRDATAAVEALGGTVLGGVLHPLGTTDFSALLLDAQTSGAQVIAFANTGADMINAVKQAGEFGLRDGSRRFAALFAQLSDVHALDAQAARGLLVTEAFYWDQNEATRAFSKRFAARMEGRPPTEDQAGVYSATLAYLRAIRSVGSKQAAAVMAALKATPIEDALFGSVTIRNDGRAIHAMHQFRAKPPSSSGGWDIYEHLETIPPALAFRPLEAGGCALVSKSP
jgi:branched-chain amino acid transport system substrate-binding protein